MKTLKTSVQIILCALRDEMLERESQGYDEIFGQNGTEFMQKLARRFIHMPSMPEEDEQRIACRIVNSDFITFLGKATPRGEITITVDGKKVKKTEFHDDHGSLEILRTNIAAMNALASAGAFQDPNYAVAVKTTVITSWLARDIGFYKELAENKLT